SPTGHLHIGGARTALYNWALAHPDGRFLLRIEDTDQARSSDEAARGILEDLAWLGIAWDEGPALAGLGGDPRGGGPWRPGERAGLPTYHLAVVVDDELMGVTHVLRGQEHLNNTPRHRALQRALGYREPVYAHLPVIFNADGSKMSKRDKDKAAREAVKARLA